MSDAELSSEDYDAQWEQLRDFIRFNPAARHRRRHIANEILKLPRPVQVLDAGCGLGFTLAHIQTLLPEAALSGLDFSAGAIAWASNRFPMIDWKCGDLTSMDFLEEFDLVICTEVIEHVRDYERVIENLCKAVRPGGHLILTTQSGRVHQTERYVGHLRHFKKQELLSRLSEQGFTSITALCWGWPALTMLKYFSNIRPEKTIEIFGSGTYGRISRGINHIAYFLTRWISLNSSPFGSQIVITCRKLD